MKNNLYRLTNFENTLDAINDKLVDRLGGHLRVRHVKNIRYLDYISEYDNVNTQTIEFGENLLDYCENCDSTGICTRVIPLGSRLENSDIPTLEQYTDISSVNGGVMFLQSDEMIKKYGIITRTVHFDDISEPENLKKKGEEYLSDIQFENLTIECKAIDLNMTDEQFERIKIGDKIRVISPPHNMDRFFNVYSLTIDLQNPENNVINLGGNYSNSFTERSVSQNSEILKKIERLDEFPSQTEILAMAKANATALITAATTGHVVLRPNEILIMDTDDFSSAEKVWRWNVNGLGYSSSGYDGEYGLAMTMDGAIVADYITTGTLNGELLKAESVKASAISQEFKTEIQDKISNESEMITQNFTAADNTLKSLITSKISDLKSETSTLILQTKSEIYLEVSENYTSENDFKSTVNTLRSSISQNAENISLKVSKNNLVSEINQSAGVIKLTSNRFIVESDNFKLSQNGTITASNVNLNGTFKTGANGYTTEITNGQIEISYSEKRVGVIVPIFWNYNSERQAQLGILGSTNYDGIAIGQVYNSDITPFYRMNMNEAYDQFGCRHYFTGDVKFVSGKFKSNVNFDDGIGISCGGNLALRYYNSSQTSDTGLWLGITANSCQTYLRAGGDLHLSPNSVIKLHKMTYVYGGMNIERNNLNFDSNYGISWGGNIGIRYLNTSSPAGVWVGIGNCATVLNGTQVRCNAPLYTTYGQVTTSDVRKKKDIQDIDEKYLKLIENISAKSFKYKAQNDDKIHLGFIAQDVLKALKEVGLEGDSLVQDINGDGSEYAIDYTQFIPIIWEVLKHILGGKLS